MEYKSFIEDLATETGELASSLQGDLKINFKAPKDMVTNADLQCNELITEKILKHFPDHNILTEEADLINKNSDYTWYVDPIDGTNNYARGMDEWCVSIGLVKDKTPIAGGIIVPTLNRFYYAEQDKGAYLNNERIFVSKRDSLDKFLITFMTISEGSLRKYQNDKKYGQIILDSANNFEKVRILGSACYDIALLASGVSDVYYNRSASLWDVVAGAVILKEAGAVITDYENNPWTIDSDNFLASNNKCHNEVIQILFND